MKNPILSVLEESRAPIRIHLIGVAGSGMSGLAWLFLELGHRVSGSDRVSSGETERLREAGLDFSSPHTARAVEDVDMVVYSSAIRPGNVAYDAAEKLGIPLVRRAEALAAVMKHKAGVVVAGTHGKTTTSALAAHIFRVAGMRPSHYVGAEIPVLGRNAAWSEEGELFVAEGDESDGTLVFFHPKHVILLNVEAEHLDYYDDLDQIKGVYSQLLDQTSSTIVYCGADEGARELGLAREGARSYGWDKEGCDYSAEILNSEPGATRFRAFKDGEILGDVTLGIPGKHNVLNALAVIALSIELGVVFTAVQMGMETFRGARRRFDVKYASARFTVVDDYGHHPTEIRATLETAQSLGPGRLVVVFQPHRYSRTQLLKKEFGAAFGGVDSLFVADVYPASEKPLPGVSGMTIVDEVLAHGCCSEVRYGPDKGSIHHAVGNALRPGDLLLTLGAGDIHEIGTRLSRDVEVLDGVLDCLGDLGGTARLYEPMSRHSTILIGGPAQYWIEPETVEAFVKVVSYLRREAIPLRVVGRGSNLLVRDGGISGAVIHPSKGEFGEVVADAAAGTITAGVGARFKKVASAAAAAGIGGFEWMEGIPGNVGGGIRMNAGAMGVETFDQVVSVRYLDDRGELHEKGVDEIAAYYRSVPEFDSNLAVSATFKGTRFDEGGDRRGAGSLESEAEDLTADRGERGLYFSEPERGMAGGKAGGGVRFQRPEPGQCACLRGAWKFYRKRGRSLRERRAGTDRKDPGGGDGGTWDQAEDRSADLGAGRSGGRVNQLAGELFDLNERRWKTIN